VWNIKRIIALLVMFSLILAGCSGITNSSKKSGDSGNRADTEAMGTVESNNTDMKIDVMDKNIDVDVEITDTLPEPINLSDRSLGKASFTVDKEKTASLQYTADGKEKSISVKDDSGFEWTLSIPGNSLINEEEITITPLDNIEVDAMPGSKLHVIMLEPDGLDFLKCAAISVKKPGESIKGVLLTGKHDGSELVFCPVDAYDGGIKAPIEHFSTVVYVPDNDPSTDKLKEKAKKQYDEAVEAAKELLKRPITVPPPPSISFECMNDQKIAKAMEYAELVTREEEEIVNRLLSADKVMFMVSDNYKSDFSLAIKVMERMDAKVRTLIRQYEPDPEKLLAVYHAAYRAWRPLRFFTNDDKYEMVYFISWTEKARKHYLDKFTKEHEYKAFGAAFTLDKYSSTLGGYSNLDEIFKTLVFKLTVETVLNVPGYLITVKGEGTLRALEMTDDYVEKGLNPILYPSIDETLFVQGIGTLGYRYDGADPDLTILPEEFPVKMQVRKWKPCESNKINILIESLGSDDETHVYETTSGKISYNDPIVNDFAEGFFEEERTEVAFIDPSGTIIGTDMFNFEVDLRDGTALAAVKTIDRKQPETEARIMVHLQLEHTPE